MKSVWEKYRDYAAQNRAVEYSVFFDSLPPVMTTHKWVGAQSVDSDIYGIPSDMNAVLKFTAKGSAYLGKLGNNLFKWTGGCIWNGCLYGFSRSSNNLLKMELDTEAMQLIPVGEAYAQEHHYGGICIKDGIVYQPPRDSDHILVWDLKTEKTAKLHLPSEPNAGTFRYCGSILHPNGYAYLLPELGEKVIKLNAATGAWSFIGKSIDAMVFDAKVAVDNRIYGFSAYCDGILRIDVDSEQVDMIHTEIRPGAFGTKLGVNGHLYSIPGDGDAVWDYDPLSDSLECIYRFPQHVVEKYAGGITMRNGDICGMPARQNDLFHLKADGIGLEIPGDVYRDYFVDCY